MREIKTIFATAKFFLFFFIGKFLLSLNHQLQHPPKNQTPSTDIFNNGWTRTRTPPYVMPDEVCQKKTENLSKLPMIFFFIYFKHGFPTDTLFSTAFIRDEAIESFYRKCRIMRPPGPSTKKYQEKPKKQIATVVLTA